MRYETLPRALRIFWVIALAVGLWVGAVHMFAHHHHENFQLDNDCAVCKVISTGVRLTHPSPALERISIFAAAIDLPLSQATPVSVRFLKLRAPSTSPPPA